MANLYERMNLAVSNLSQGDLGGAGASILAPDTLSPEQRKTLSDRLGIENDERFKKLIVETAGNPMFAAGILASLRYPIAPANKLYTYRWSAVNETKRLGLLARMTSPVQVQFANTPIPELMLEMGFKKEEFNAQFTRKVADALSRFMEKTGTTELSADTQRKLAAYLDGLYDPSHVWNKRLSKFGVGPLMKNPASVMSPAEIELGESLRTVYSEIFDKVYYETPGAKTAILEVLEKKLGKKGLAGDLTNVTTIKRTLTKNLGQLPEEMQKTILSMQKAKTWKNVRDYDRLAKVFTKGGWLGKEAFQPRQAKEALVTALEKQGIVLDKDIQFLKHYYPHVVRITEQDYEEYLKGLMDVTGGSGKKSEALNRARTTNVLSTSAYKRKDLMVPDMDEMQRLADLGVVDAKGFEALKKYTKWDAETRRFLPIKGLEERTFRQYSLRAEPVMAKYIKDMGTQHVWTGLRYGEKIKAATERLDPIGKKMMSETYIPQMMGKLTDKQAFQSLEWAATRDRWVGALQKGEGMAAYIPASFRKFLTKQFMEYSGPVTWHGVSGKLADYFYSSTLGLNVGSALKNSLQTFLTLMPEIGPDATFKGMKEASSRIGKYIQMRGAGVAKETAWGKVFAEFEEAGLDVNPMTSQLSRSYVEDAYDLAIKKSSGKLGLLTGGQGHKVKVLGRKANEVMMKAFKGTETWNRVVAFFGGAAKYARDIPNAPKHEILRFARDTVLKTQFPAGAGQSPYAIANLNPLARQFLHFPGRFLGNLLTSLHQPTVRAGKVIFPKGYNWGTIGRTLAISTIIYQIGKEIFDTDLSGGLLTGALPLPQQEDAPFYPFPVVPPVISLAGSAAQSIMTGDMTSMKYALPIMIPGGIAASKLRNAFSPEFADYNNRTPDGKIPLYTSTGSLKGYRSPMQLVGKAIGLGNMPDKKESELLGYLVKQKDIIRDYRRQYLEALYMEDMSTAERIQMEFQKEMPGLGKLEVKKQDLKALQVRKMTTRMERTLNTMPVQYREEYRQMISRVLGIEALQGLQHDPSLYGPVPITRGRLGGSRSNTNSLMGPQNFNAYQVGQKYGTNLQYSSFGDMSTLPPLALGY